MVLLVLFSPSTGAKINLENVLEKMLLLHSTVLDVMQVF